MMDAYRVLDRRGPEFAVMWAQDAPGLERLLQLHGESAASLLLMPSYEAGTGDSLLYHSVNHEWANGVALCLKYGADPQRLEPYRRETPLRFAQRWLKGATDERLSHAQYILVLLGDADYTVDTPIIDATGDDSTALMRAADKNDYYALACLMAQRGANPHARDRRGRTALYYAISRVNRQRRQQERLQRTAVGRRNADAQVAPLLDPSIALLIERVDPIPYEYGFPKVVAQIRQEAARRLRAQAGAPFR